VDLEGDRRAAVERVLEAGVFTTFGREVPGLEMELSIEMGAFAIATNTGTSALALGLSALMTDGVVLVPAVCCAAVPIAVRRAGYRPFLVDVGSDGLIDPVSVSEELQRRNVAAVIGVDLDGRVADWDLLRDVAASARVPLIHDACPSFGGTYGDERIGALNGVAFTAISFNDQKLIQAGEGGAVLTDDDRIADHVAAARAFGEIRSQGARLATFRGDNCRMTEMSAALAQAGLRNFNALTDRAVLAQEAAARVLGGDMLRGRKGSVQVRGRMAFRGIDMSRAEIAARLAMGGAPVVLDDPPPLYAHPFFKGPALPGAEAFWSRTWVLGDRHAPLCRMSQSSARAAAHRVMDALSGNGGL
jgi:dTDP-4-amino-4,6-dideoxygalactose transaminase